MFAIHERIGPDGAAVATSLQTVDGGVRVLVGARPVGELPFEALEKVVEHYGKALADGIVLDGPCLDLGEGRSLRMLRHRAYYDVIARDFVVLVRPGAEPITELATTIAGALAHLAQAATEAKRGRDTASVC